MNNYKNEILSVLNVLTNRITEKEIHLLPELHALAGMIDMGIVIMDELQNRVDVLERNIRQLLSDIDSADLAIEDLADALALKED